MRPDLQRVGGNVLHVGFRCHQLNCWPRRQARFRNNAWTETHQSSRELPTCILPSLAAEVAGWPPPSTCWPSPAACRPGSTPRPPAPLAPSTLCHPKPASSEGLRVGVSFTMLQLEGGRYKSWGCEAANLPGTAWAISRPSAAHQLRTSPAGTQPSRYFILKCDRPN